MGREGPGNFADDSAWHTLVGLMDKLIDDNMHQTDPQKRLAAAREAQKILIDDAVWGFLWYDSWTRVMRSDLVGLEKRWDTFERYYAVKRG